MPLRHLGVPVPPAQAAIKPPQETTPEPLSAATPQSGAELAEPASESSALESPAASTSEPAPSAVEPESEPAESEEVEQLLAEAGPAEFPSVRVSLFERLRWYVRAALLVFLLSAVAFLSFIVTIRIATHGREVEVPSIMEMKLADAEKELAIPGLGLRVADRVYSPLPADQVIRQSPAPGTIVKTGQRVYVAVSLGPREVATPLLEGKSLRAARLEVLRSGLELGQVSSCRLPGYEPERVVRQNPPPKIKLLGSPRVSLLVAQPPGEPGYVMPDLLGQSLAEAQRDVGAAGLRLARVDFSGSGTGVVTRQKPERGARVALGSEVTLEIGSPGAENPVLQ